ncbi:MAG TPA: DNA repair protein RecO [Geobacteraceae bacterium]
MNATVCDAIVIGTMDYREADRIVTLFTLEHGILRGLARGARRSVKRFAGALEPFARLRVQLVLKEGLSTLNEAEPLTVHPRLRGELARIALAGYACELAGALLPEHLPNPRLYRLLATFLGYLDQAPAESADRRFFEINLLNILGYRPPLADCQVCGADLAMSGGILPGPGVHGIRCPACARGGRRLSATTVTLLRRALQCGRFGLLRFPPAELAEAGELLDNAIASHLNRPLKSLAFLAELPLQSI